MRRLLGGLAALCAVVSATGASPPALLYGVLPAAVPVDTPGLALQLFFAAPAGGALDAAIPVELTLPHGGGLVALNATLGKAYTLEAPVVATPGTALLQVAGSLLPPLALTYYAPPLFSGAVVVNNVSVAGGWSIGSSGFDIVSLGLDPFSPDVNVPTPLVLASCAWRPVVTPGGGTGAALEVLPQGLSSGYALHRPVLQFRTDGSVAAASLTLDDLSPANLAASSAARAAIASATGLSIDQYLADLFNASSSRGHGGIFEYSVGSRLEVDASGQRALVFETSQLPADACPAVSFFVSLNGGITAHYSGVTASLVYRPPLKVASLYPYTIATSPFVAAHNQARVKTASLFNGPLDMSTYYESAWAVPALDTGVLIAPASFNRSIAVDGASFIVCAGTQFSATARDFANRLPSLRVLVMSTLRSAPAPTTNRNFVQTTGRMYEAMFVAGMAAGATTRTGRLGFLMALNQPTSYAFVNAFYMGAVYAAETGAARPGLRPEHIKVSAFVVGSFSNEWAEINAAVDLLDGQGDQALAVGAAEAAPVVTAAGNSASSAGPAALPSRSAGIDVLFPVTDSPLPQQECHKRGCVSLGFNADERLALGDSVLTSTVFDWAPIYIRYARRIITGSPFFSPDEDGYAGGLGAGVEVSSLSPVVPLAGRKAAEAVAATLRAGTDATERVFCSSLLVDSRGTVRLNASAAWAALVAAGKPASNETLYGRGSAADPVADRFSAPLSAAAAAQQVAAGAAGSAPLACLRRSDVYAMSWTLAGVKAAVYSPPPKPVPAKDKVWHLLDDSGTLAELTIPAALTIVLSLASAVLVLACRRANPFKYSSPVFLLVLLAGTLLYSVWLLMVAWVIPDDSDTLCTASPWVMGTAFALTYGSLFAKTYRIHRLFNNRKLKRLRITARYVLQLVAGIVVAELLLVLALELLFPRGITMKRSAAGNLGDTPVLFPVCGAIDSSTTANPPDGYVILNAAQLLLLVWGSWCAFRTRNVPLAFNESRWIAVSIYIFILCEIVGITVSAAFSVSPTMQYTAFTMRGGISPLVTVLAIFGPKAYAVCSGKVRDVPGSTGEDVVIGRGKAAVAPPGASASGNSGLRLPRALSGANLLRAVGVGGGDDSGRQHGASPPVSGSRSSGLVSGVSRGGDFLGEPLRPPPPGLARAAFGGTGAGGSNASYGLAPLGSPTGDDDGDADDSPTLSASPTPFASGRGPSASAGARPGSVNVPVLLPPAPAAPPAAGFRGWWRRLTHHSASSSSTSGVAASGSPVATLDTDAGRGHHHHASGHHHGTSATGSSSSSGDALPPGAGGAVNLRESRLKLRLSDVSIGGPPSGSLTYPAGHPHHADAPSSAASTPHGGSDKEAGGAPASAPPAPAAAASAGGKIRKFVRIASGNKLVATVGEPAAPAPAPKPSSGRSSARVAPAPPAGPGADTDTGLVWGTVTQGHTGAGGRGAVVSVEEPLEPAVATAGGGGGGVVVTVFSDARSGDDSGGSDGSPTTKAQEVTTGMYGDGTTATSHGRQRVVTAGLTTTSGSAAGDERSGIESDGDGAGDDGGSPDSEYGRDVAHTIDPLADTTTTTNGWGLSGGGVNTVTATDAI